MLALRLGKLSCVLAVLTHANLKFDGRLCMGDLASAKELSPDPPCTGKLASAKELPPASPVGHCGGVCGGCGSTDVGISGAGCVGGSVGGLVLLLFLVGLLLLLLLAVLLACSPGGLDNNVSVCSSVLFLSSNSQHGTTICPDGAISACMLSVPGGRAACKS